MTEQRAKQILATLRKYGVVNQVAIPVDSGPTLWHIPAGVAGWYNHEPCRGGIYYGADLEITCWPRCSIFALYEGVGNGPQHIPRMSRFHLWQQEAYIYAQQTNTALKRAMLEMDKLIPIPRQHGHSVNDIDPYPEDFGLDVSAKTNQIAAEAIENWLRQVPIET